MLRFITSRFLQSLLALFLVITATFFMVRFVPGGPFTAEKAVTPEILRNLEAHYGLDKPLGQQYLDYLGSLARGDLGPSFKYPNRTVNEIIFDKVPVSAELGSISLAVALVLGIGLGTLAAIRRNTWVDYVASSFGMIGISIPTFVVGPLLVLALAIHLGWFNASGWYGPADRVLPALVLGIAYAAPISRLTRGGLLEVLNQDFIRTARAKGASEFRRLLPRPRRRRHPHRLVRHRNNFPNPRHRPRIRQQRLQPRLHPRTRNRDTLRRPHHGPQPRRRHRPGLDEPQSPSRILSPP